MMKFLGTFRPILVSMAKKPLGKSAITMLVCLLVLLCVITYTYYTLHSTIYQQPYLTTNTLTQSSHNAAQEVRVFMDNIYFGLNPTLSRYFNSRTVKENYTDQTDRTRVKRFPKCICIGSDHAGTKALETFLDIHPNVKSVGRELMYFAYGKDFGQSGYEKYLSKMPYVRKEELVLSRSPTYTASVDRQVPKRLHDFDAFVKLLYVVRDPIQRTMSEFYHHQRNNQNSNRTFQDLAIREDGTFRTNYPPIKNSLYAKHLSGWYEYFPRHQIHIVNGDQLCTNPFSEIAKIEEFLDVDPLLKEESFYINKTRGFYCYKPTNGIPRCLDDNIGHKYQPIAEDLNRKLHQFFEPFNQKFFGLIGQDFNWNKT